MNISKKKARRISGDRIFVNYETGLLSNVILSEPLVILRNREPDAPKCQRADWIAYDGDQLNDFLRRLSEAWLKQETVRDAVLFNVDSSVCS